jgi:hemerythrin
MLDYPQVALEFMNRDHTEFVAQRAALLASLAAQAPEALLDGQLDELLNHTRHHFAEEERLMQETRFPPFPVHKGEHDAVLADMSSKIDHWKQGRNLADLRDWLEGPVGDWFINHVKTMDFITAGFIKAQN